MSMDSQEREVIQNLIDRLDSDNAGCGIDVHEEIQQYLRTWIAGPLFLLLSDAEHIGEQRRKPLDVALSMSRR